MLAVVRKRFGVRALELREVEKPVPGPGETLVRVRASSVNAADWYTVAGRPLFARPMFGVFRPRDPRVGIDFAGVVEAVGAGVDHVAPGDEVYGCRDGAFAQYVAVEKAVAPKPANA